jgi:hypothetical protein
MQQIPLFILNNATQLNIIDKVYDLNMFVIFISLFIVFVLLLLTKVSYEGYYPDLFYAIIRPDNLSKAYIEENISYIRTNRIAQIASILSIATAMFAILSYTPYFRYFSYNFDFRKSSSEISLSVIWDILLIYAGLVAFVMIYIIFHRFVTSIIGHVTEERKIMNAYFQFGLNLMKALGIILLPICIVLPFVDNMLGKWLIYCILFMFGTSFLIKMIIFIFASIKIKFLNLYSILYFYIFEILPLLFLGKLTLIG